MSSTGFELALAPSTIVSFVVVAVVDTLAVVLLSGGLHSGGA